MGNPSKETAEVKTVLLFNNEVESFSLSPSPKLAPFELEAARVRGVSFSDEEKQHIECEDGEACIVLICFEFIKEKLQFMKGDVAMFAMS